VARLAVLILSPVIYYHSDVDGYTTYDHYNALSTCPRCAAIRTKVAKAQFCHIVHGRPAISPPLPCCCRNPPTPPFRDIPCPPPLRVARHRRMRCFLHRVLVLPYRPPADCSRPSLYCLPTRACAYMLGACSLTCTPLRNSDTSPFAYRLVYFQQSTHITLQM
jgi:hypothetical protein